MEDLQACKDWMNARLKNGSIGDEDGGGAQFVVGCSYHGHADDGELQHELGWGQQCHAHVPLMASRCIIRPDGGDAFAVEVMLDHIQGGDRQQIEKLQTREESVKFLQYFMDHLIFSKSFLEHDAEKAFEERIMVRDLGSLPANAAMFAIIATRALWETYQSRIPHVFCELLKTGINPDFAYILAFYLRTMNDGSFIIDPLINSGHISLGTDRFTTAAVKNYLNHEMPVSATGTLKDGVSHMNDPYGIAQGPRWNVFSLFEPAFSKTYGPLPKNAVFFRKALEDYFNKVPVNADTLKQLEAQYRE